MQSISDQAIEGLTAVATGDLPKAMESGTMVMTSIIDTLSDLFRVDLPGVFEDGSSALVGRAADVINGFKTSKTPGLDTSKYAGMSGDELENFVNTSDIGRQLFSQFSGKTYEDPGEKVGTTGWGYAVSPQGFDAFDKKLEEFQNWLQTPISSQKESPGIMPGPKQEPISTINPQQQTGGGGGSGHTFIMQTGDIIVKAEQDIDMLFKKFEQFVAAQLPGRGILG